MKGLRKKTTKLNSVLTPLLAVCILSAPQILNAQINYTVQSRIVPQSFEDLLLALLNIFVIIATPIIILFIIYAGFLYVTARGNAEQVKKATTALTYAIIGGILVIGAVAITEGVKNVVDSFR